LSAHDWCIGVQPLYFDGCPHWAVAEERLRSALSSLGRESESIAHVVVESDEQAEALNFNGSPTILVDGVDPFFSVMSRSGLLVGCSTLRRE
jgi:hypothetical protein